MNKSEENGEGNHAYLYNRFINLEIYMNTYYIRKKNLYDAKLRILLIARMAIYSD